MRRVRRAARGAVTAFRRVWWYCVNEYYPWMLGNREEPEEEAAADGAS